MYRDLGWVLVAVASSAAAAQEAEPAAPDIVVTATRTGSALDTLPISVSVVDADAIAQQVRQNRNILTGLEFAVPGLSIQESQDRGSCSTSIRGRNASLQINGVPVNEDLRPGSCTGPFAVTPFAIERVEVVRGGTALYGAGSPGGIINLVTRRAKGDALEVDAVAQTSFNTARARGTFTTDLYAGTGQQRGDLDFYVGVGLTDGGRVRSATGAPVYSNAYRGIDAVLGLGYSLGPAGEVRLTGTFHSENVGAQFYPNGTVDADGLARVVDVAAHPQRDQGHDRQLTVALAYDHPDLLGHKVSLSAFYQGQSIKQRDNFFSARDGNDFFASNRENERIGLRSAFTRDWGIGRARLRTTVGLDYTDNRFLRFLVDTAAQQRVTGYITPEIVLRTTSGFAQGEFEIGPITISGGARREWYRGEVTSTGFNAALPRAATPGAFGKSSLTLYNIGAVFRVTPDIQLYGGFSQGAELSELGRAARGVRNPATITPEPAPSSQFELGVRGTVGPVTFGLAGYLSRSEFSSQVRPDPSCAGAGFCPLIPFRVPERFRGVEANVSWVVSPMLKLSGVATVQRGKIFDESLGRFISYGTDVAVPLRVTARAEWRPIERVRTALQVTHYGASSYFSPNEEAIGLVETKAVTLASGSVAYDLGNVELYVSADNLFDRRYISPASQVQGFGGFTYAQAPGRRVTLGVAARF